jgi:SIR2-like protein
LALEDKKKVAYLFGAGATHAELLAFKPDLTRETDGLLISDVSSRVIAKASADDEYRRDLETVSATSGSLNIELLISLIENSKIHDWSSKTRLLKDFVEADIKGILTPYRQGRFYLHRALLQFHRHRTVREKEEIIGFISLNYDDVLDRAYRQYYGEPNYCFTLEDEMRTQKVPLLKLHGSFNWTGIRIRSQRRTIEIIPLGSTKSYIHAPYTFIWNRALEILVNCDTLRVVGCSLSPNDLHLIDLLFKAHLERQEAFDIEIIASEETGTTIRSNYGFFPNIRPLLSIENSLIPDPAPRNPFATWLKYKSLSVLGVRSVRRLNYLRNVL